MKKNLVKVFGKGLAYGAMHPFQRETPKDRQSKMDLTETVIDSMGIVISQSTIQTICGGVVVLAAVYGLGVIAKKAESKPVKANKTFKK